MKRLKERLPWTKRPNVEVCAEEVNKPYVKKTSSGSRLVYPRQTLQNSSLTTVPAFFRVLPVEIRDNIYTLLLYKPEPIIISSPLLKIRSWLLVDKERFGNIRRVSKRMYEESSFIYYTINIFAIGNGPWQSHSPASLKGLQAFTACVPADNMALIRNIRVVLYCNLLAYNPFQYLTGSPLKYNLGTLIEASNLFILRRSITQNFKGLIELGIVLTCKSQQYEEKWLLSSEDEAEFFLKFIKEIVKETNLRLIRYHRHQSRGLESALRVIRRDSAEVKKLMRARR